MASRDETLANFMAMTDIFDFEIALAYLEDAGWNLMNAVSIFTSQQQNPAAAAASGSNSSTSTGSNVPKAQPPPAKSTVKPVPEVFELDSSQINEEEVTVASLNQDVDFIHDSEDSGRYSPEDNKNDFQYEVLSTEQIVDHMKKVVDEVNETLEIPSTTTRILLHHFKWDKEKLLERYFSDQRDSLFSEAKVVSPYQNDQKIKNDLQTSPSKTSLDKSVECQICFLVIPVSKMTGLECQHTFCTDCWRDYLSGKINDEGVSQSIECPDSSCDILVNDQTVLKLIADPRIKQKYQKLITESFVDCNRRMTWCPGNNCENAIRVQYVEANIIKCHCGHSFCFGCSDKWHIPVSCKVIKKWIKKCKDDSETCNWINANTKDCPKCNSAIEKNGGCNHMVCRRESCKHQFCWMCLGDWDKHGSRSYYKCNSYDEKNEKKSVEGSRASLERYLFYYNRYANHQNSLNLEKDLYNKVKEKMDELQLLNMTWIEVQYLKKAVDILSECRQTLMNTYVFAFYIMKNNQKDIFEDNQKFLETETENLSGYLERDIDNENNQEIKIKVQDLCKRCIKQQKNILEHVQEGNEKSWWADW